MKVKISRIDENFWSTIYLFCDQRSTMISDFFPKTNYALAKSKKLHQRAVGLLGKECLVVRHSV